LAQLARRVRLGGAEGARPQRGGGARHALLRPRCRPRGDRRGAPEARACSAGADEHRLLPLRPRGDRRRGGEPHDPGGGRRRGHRLPHRRDARRTVLSTCGHLLLAHNGRRRTGPRGRGRQSRGRALMGRYVPDEIEAYAERYTSARWDVFERLGAETESTQRNHGMMVGLLEGAFLSFLVFMTRAKRVLEVGTFTGWS